MLADVFIKVAVKNEVSKKEHQQKEISDPASFH